MPNIIIHVKEGYFDKALKEFKSIFNKKIKPRFSKKAFYVKPCQKRRNVVLGAVYREGKKLEAEE